MSMEFGAGGGQGNRPSLLKGCLAAPWEVAFVTSKVQWVEEQKGNTWEELCHYHSECPNTLHNSREEEKSKLRMA